MLFENIGYSLKKTEYFMLTNRYIVVQIFLRKETIANEAVQLFLQ